MPTIPIPDKVRFAIYVISAVGSAVVAYLKAAGYIGDNEVTLWLALAAIASTVSASNVTKQGEKFIP